MKRFWLLLLMGTMCLGIASAQVEEEVRLLLLEVETAPHPEPWPQPRVNLFVWETPRGFDFDFPRLSREEPCEVTWEDCPGHRSCVSKAEAERRESAWRRQAARTLRLYGWTVIEPPEEDQTGEVRTSAGEPGRGRS